MTRTTMFSALAAIALLPLFAGCCSQSGQIARGQAPPAGPAPAAVANEQAASGQTGEEFCYDGDPECDDMQGMNGCPYCRGRGCQNCWVPYHVPHDFVFPQAGPPAVVQYPYYVCKGPDCFFLDPDGP